MDENTWRFAQLMMWLIGLQSAILIAILGVIWSKINRMDEKVSNIDKTIFGIESAMRMKDCCMLKDERLNRKIE